MSLKASYTKQKFYFNFEARTSRGPIEDKTSWFIKVWDDSNPETVGIGEAGPLPGLSLDAVPNFETVVAETITWINETKASKINELSPNEFVRPGFPALRFALETAIADFQHEGKRKIFETDFNAGVPIPINGLVWMGDREFMIRQIDQKIEDGFNCLKLKVGSLDFEQECEVLHYIRNHHSNREIDIRLDANGAFGADALAKLRQLAKFGIHSIEQPIRPGQREMEQLCRSSPIPVALDEELIGKEKRKEKEELLDRIRPQYIILKPTLHGGMAGCAEWIDLAEKLQIGWWITSALESNVGLNAICQFAAMHRVSVPQGLGTGSLYSNNIPSPLCIRDGNIFVDTNVSWDLRKLD